MDRNSPLREIKGVGAKTEELFHKIGVYTVGDILLHYPRTYIQYPQAKHVDEVLDGEQAAVLGRITRTAVVRKVRTGLLYTSPSRYIFATSLIFTSKACV